MTAAVAGAHGAPSCAVCSSLEARTHLTTCEPCERHAGAQARRVPGLVGVLQVQGAAPGSAGSSGGAPRAPGYGSTSPARDEALALLDDRGNDSVAGVLARWVGVAVDEGARGAAGTPRAAGDLAAWLASWSGLEWLSGSPRAGDVVRALDRLVERLEAVVGDAEPLAPVGACPRAVERRTGPGQVVRRACGGLIRAAVYGSRAECRRCGAQWQGAAAWRELGTALGDAELDAAGLARYLDVPVGTVRRWASEDGWTRQRRGRRTLFSLAEARAAYARRSERAPRVSA